MASRTVSFIGVASANTLGFGFIRYASGAATRRGGKQLADDAGCASQRRRAQARSADSHPVM
jgi:hypothetical protein